MGGVWYKFKTAVQRFMYGRNGADQLGRTAMWAALAVDVVSVVALRRYETAGRLLYAVAMALLVYAMFRLFSKNLSKRREENSKWLNWVWQVKNRHAGAKARHADKEHKYFTCKQCKTICRVPVGKGKVVLTCPKCGAQIQGRT